ncbi:unnamed protein product [Linum tenue]|uniref:Inhibitor I9 domain-containing protein n=1 Tax=Linum tenue TaxID=586396 RepID=A0AAV0I2V8_9ROSI|nr:unnamed protein product [Linum tenue]
MRSFPPNSSPLLSPLLLFFVVSAAIATMTDSVPSAAAAAAAQPASAAVHIVYTERPEGNEEPEAYHIRTLASVLGSEQAAKDAMLYSYKTAASGFSAKLTPEQVEQISRQPGVLQVVPSRTVQLHSGPGKLH